jgi:L-threonylcarbamoyladenylate synthase
MLTEVLPVDAERPEAAVIARAAAVLRRGGLVAFPTETVYGLGANALDPEAVAGIFRAKGRPANNPLIVHVAGAGDAPLVVASWPDAAEALARRFWPGPLTLVLPRTAAVPDVVTGGGPTVAVRVPSHPVAHALVEAAGGPVAAPSANRSGLLSPTRAEHVLRGLDGRIDLLLDGGPTPGGLESTVVDLTTSPPRLLRPGLLPHAALEALVGPVVLSNASTAAEGAALPSPGLLTRHYAPRTPLECVEGDAIARVRELGAAGERVGWLIFGRSYIWNNLTSPPHAFTAQLPGEAVECAAQLYDLLHQLDNIGLTRLVVEMPPSSPEWLAVRDRLRRAAL